ncbi:MAG: DUF4259 domain-containing protein, partial [Rubripirellula sp.]
MDLKLFRTKWQMPAVRKYAKLHSPHPQVIPGGGTNRLALCELVAPSILEIHCPLSFKRGNDHNAFSARTRKMNPWGIETFENEIACDWLEDLQDAEPVAFVKESLH